MRFSLLTTADLQLYHLVTGDDPKESGKMQPTFVERREEKDL
jgi:hypothetical protein